MVVRRDWREGHEVSGRVWGDSAGMRRAARWLRHKSNNRGHGYAHSGAERGGNGQRHGDA